MAWYLFCFWNEQDSVPFILPLIAYKCTESDSLIRILLERFQGCYSRNRQKCVLLATDILCTPLFPNWNKNSNSNFPKRMRPKSGLLKYSSPGTPFFVFFVLQQTAILFTHMQTFPTTRYLQSLSVRVGERAGELKRTVYRDFPISQ